MGVEAYHLGAGGGGANPRRRKGPAIRPEGQFGPGITPVCGQRGDVSEGRGAGKTGVTSQPAPPLPDCIPLFLPEAPAKHHG